VGGDRVPLSIKRKSSIKFFKKVANKELTVNMLKYSAPLIFTGIAWWVNGSSDRIFITMFAGVALNGIYAVANKIPSILSAFHGIIYQALQLSVFAEVHSDNDEKYLEKLYNIYNSAMVCVASSLIIVDVPLAKLLFKKEFFAAWHYVPALLISTVLFSVSGYITTIAAANKNTKLIANATVTGAIINSILNIILIPQFKVYGAVIATIVGYFFIWLSIILGIMKQSKVRIDIFKSIVLYLLLIFQWCVLLFIDNYYVYDLFILVLIILLVRSELKNVIMIMIKMIKSKLKKET